MSHLAILKTLEELTRRLERLEAQSSNTEAQFKRLSKEQYKANTLSEAQATRLQTALETLQQTLAIVETEQAQRIKESRLTMAQQIFPVLDSIESGIQSGMAQVKALQTAMPEAASTLSAWLKGQHLLRERLLRLLQSEDVERIPTIGQVFDPQYHIAVKAVSHPQQEQGVILAEERAGYRHTGTVLRYAEVIVNRKTP